MLDVTAFLAQRQQEDVGGVAVKIAPEKKRRSLRIVMVDGVDNRSTVCVGSI